MTPDDKLLLDQLEHRRPEDWETVSELAAKSLSRMRPDLIRHVASFGRLNDVDNFVDEVILKAFERFRDQYRGKKVPMPFTDQHAGRVEDLFKGWLLAMIGKPFAGTRSGMITNAIRKQDKEVAARASAEVECALEQNITDPAEGYFTVEEARAKVASVLRELPPMHEFAYRIHTGLHDQERLAPDTVVQIARSCRVDEALLGYIKIIAKEILDDGYASLTLNQSATGKLAKIGERQVRKIVSDVRAFLKSKKSKLSGEVPEAIG